MSIFPLAFPIGVDQYGNILFGRSCRIRSVRWPTTSTTGSEPPEACKFRSNGAFITGTATIGMQKLINFANKPSPDEPTSDNSPLRNDPLLRRHRFRMEPSGRPTRQLAAKTSRTSDILFIHHRAGRTCRRPYPIPHPIARRSMEIPFRRRHRPKPCRFLASRCRPDRLGRNSRSFVLGDAGLRLPDLYQRRLSL